MVVSKKCKVCTAQDADNIAIYGDFYDKSLPDLIEKLSGIKLDPRKANSVLICKLCATQLLYTDVFIDKLRSTLQRLTKLVKETKQKTPIKDATEDNSKLKSKINLEKDNFSILDCNLFKVPEEQKQNIKEPESITTSAKNQNEPKTNTPKRVIRRKSVFRSSDKERNIQNGDAEIKVSTTEFKQNLKSSITSKNVVSNLHKQKKETGEEPKTSKKGEVSKDDIPYHFDDLQQIGDQARNISTTKFRKIADDAEDLPQNDDQRNNIPTTKFKKIADDKVMSVKVIQSKSGKRKEMFKENSVEGESKYLIKSDIFESTPVKRNKTVSLSALEKDSRDLVADKNNFNTFCSERSLAEVKIKILNCVICGKVFYHKASLREHVQTSHKGEKLKQCPSCSAEFRSQQKYESHVFKAKCKHSCGIENTTDDSRLLAN